MMKIKRIVSTVLAAAAALCLSSCGKASEYVPDAYACEPVQNADYYRAMIDTPTKIIYLSNEAGLLCYYNKADKKSYIFCSDPLCDHADLDCTAAKFADITQDEYCNGRLYGVWKNEIFSMSLEATDIKSVFKTDYTEENYVTLSGLKHYKQYLYFRVLKEDKGYDLYRYDSIKGKVINLTKDADFGIGEMFFGEDCLYFCKTTGVSLYRAGLDMSEITSMPDCKIGAFDGTYTYGPETEKNGDETKTIGIFRDNIANGTHEVIYTDPDGLSIHILSMDDRYIYFGRNDSVEIGRFMGNTVKSSGKLYRIDKDGKNCRLIYDKIGCDIEQIYCCRGEYFAWVDQYNVSDPKNVTNEPALRKLIFDENGNITSVMQLDITK